MQESDDKMLTLTAGLLITAGDANSLKKPRRKLSIHLLIALIALLPVR
jgi:hypothetical protein